MNKNKKLVLNIGLTFALFALINAASMATAINTNTVNEWQLACKAAHGGNVVMRPTTLNNISCSDLVPSGSQINRLCASETQPNPPNCLVSYFNSDPSASNPPVSILQCSPTLAHGMPQAVFKYVLCKKEPFGEYYWAKLQGDNSLNPSFEQKKP